MILFQKMLRDMRLNKVTFFAIFLMIFLGVFIYAGVNSDYHGMQVYSQDFYEETKLADMWVYGNDFSKEDERDVQQLKNIEQVERRAIFPMFIKGNPKKTIQLYILDSSSLSKMKVMRGESYRQDSDGIWVDQSFAKANNLKLGSMFTLEQEGIEITKEIKGFILHPELVSQRSQDGLLADHNHTGYAFVSGSKLSLPVELLYTQLLIKGNHVEGMEATIRDVLKEEHVTFIAKKDMASYAILDAEITQHKAFAAVFPIVFLLIALLTTMTSVSKMIVNQRLQIGILKALGFKNRTIIIHYISHVIVIATVAGILGYILGPIMIPSLIYPMMKVSFVLPELKGVPLQSSFYMVIASIVVCFIVAYLVCRKQLKEKPANALRPYTLPYKNKHRWNAYVWNRFRFYTQWNLRDVMRNKVRSLIAILGVAGCMGLMICAYGMQDSMNHMMNLMLHELQTYEMRIGLNKEANVDMLKKEMKGNRIFEGAIELKGDKLKKIGAITIQENNRYLKLKNRELETVKLPNDGIALSNNMANTFDVEVNDSISWRMMGQTTWHHSKVKEIIHTPSSQGITMSKDVYERMGETFIPTNIVGQSVDLSDAIGVSSILYLNEDITKRMETLMEGMNVIIAVLIMAAIVLGIVILYNIGTFSYIEKIHDMATLKVLGFRNANVKKLLWQQNLWLTMLGIGCGVPFGYTLLYTVISTVSDTMDIMIIIEPTTYFMCCISTLFVSMFIMILVSRKIKTIDMVSALKALE